MEKETEKKCKKGCDQYHICEECEPVGYISEKENNWESFERLAKEYARQSYLVSEENHPEKEEIDALNNLKLYISGAIKEERNRIVNGIEGLKKGEASIMVVSPQRLNDEYDEAISDALSIVISKENE